MESLELESGDDRPRALIVDDDALFLELCSDLMTEEGFECARAGSGSEAIELLRTRPFDLVICDILMPPPDGFRVIEEAGRSKNRPATILVTGLQQSHESVQPLLARQAPVLFKPIDPMELSRAVAWALHGRYVSRFGVPAGHLEALYGAATAANAEPVLVKLLDRLLGICAGALEADAGSIMVASDPASGVKELTIVASHELGKRSASGPVSFGEGVAGWVAEHPRPLRIVGSLTAYPQFRDLPPNDRIAESVLVPIVFRREVLGIISVSYSRPNVFRPERMSLIVGIADLAAAAMHRERLEKTREHSEKLAVLGQLSASVAHELNNPLAYIRANVDSARSMLAGEGIDCSAATRAELQSLLGETAEGVDRMLALVSTLKSQARKAPVRSEAVDLNTVASRAQVLVYPQIKHRVTLTLSLGSPAPVRGDGNRLLQVLVNLLMNAAESVDHDGRITIRTREDGGWSLLEVEDNGPGIPPEIARHVFDPFFTTKAARGGTGLGLGISKQIVDEHGGTLGFATSREKGTCFSVRLPAVARAATSGEVLVVDDELLVARALGRELEGQFEVVVRSSVQSAVEALGGEKLVAVITDYNLGNGTDGLALLRNLRAVRPSVARILISASVPEGLVRHGLAEGTIEFFLGKPWEPGEVRGTVLRAVGRQAKGPAPA